MQISNLPDFKDSSGLWVRSFIDGGVQYVTRAGLIWGNIVNRCGGNSYSGKYKTYKSCSNEFEGFQEFAEWCQNQIGYLEKEENGRFWSIDKDILVPYNKCYSESTCCFIPNELNNILTYSNRGKLPIGVTFVKDTGLYRSRCSISGKRLSLGYFDTKELAHAAWQEKKIEVIYNLIAKHQNVDHRVIKSLDKHAKMIENDLSLKKETKR